MGDVFRLDGNLMNFLTKVSDICIISMLWLLCCLPIFTIGASTTAAYYTMVKVVRRQTGTLHKEFFKSLKNNFKDSSIINLIYLVAGGILVFNLNYIYGTFETAGSYSNFNLLFIYLMFFLLVIGAGIYTYPAQSRFVMGRFQTVKFSLFVMFRHFPSTLVLLALFILTLVIMIVFPIGVLFMPGVCLYVYSFFMERILRKYMTAKMLEEWDGVVEAVAE